MPDSLTIQSILRIYFSILKKRMSYTFSGLATDIKKKKLYVSADGDSIVKLNKIPGSSLHDDSFYVLFGTRTSITYNGIICAPSTLIDRNIIITATLKRYRFNDKYGYSICANTIIIVD